MSIVKTPYFICCNFDIIDLSVDANLSTNYLEVLKFRAGWCKKILPLARPRQRELESHFNDKTSPSSRQRAVCCLSQIANNGRSFIPWPGTCAKVSPDSAGWWVRTQFLILSWKYHTQLSSSHFRRYIILRNGWRYHIGWIFGKISNSQNCSWCLQNMSVKMASEEDENELEATKHLETGTYNIGGRNWNQQLRSIYQKVLEHFVLRRKFWSLVKYSNKSRSIWCILVLRSWCNFSFVFHRAIVMFFVFMNVNVIGVWLGRMIPLHNSCPLSSKSCHNIHV